MRKNLVLLIILAGAVFLSGCATTGQRQSAYQAGTTALGALTGQLIGKDTKSTLIGAGVGYVAGGLTKEWAYPQQEAVATANRQHQRSYASSNYRSHCSPPKRYSDRYLESVYRDYNRANEILREYGEMAHYCSDYYFRPSFSVRNSREFSAYQSKRYSYKSRAASDCSYAKRRVAWAEAAIDEYNRLRRMGYF